MTSSTSAAHLRGVLEAKLMQRGKGVLGPSSNLRCVVLVDDVSQAHAEASGAQPPIELLRQALDHGGWHDVKGLHFKRVLDVTYVSTMASLAGISQSPVSPRYVRHFHTVVVAPCEDGQVRTIFSAMLRWTLRALKRPLVDQMVPLLNAATVSVYQAIQTELVPTPKRAVSKLWLGIPRSCLSLSFWPIAKNRASTGRVQSGKLWKVSTGHLD